ncbi:hypothetical protein Btru_009878 [Bulinus truncatus]|nr:hypothetical protein Btru_009878 [Bulinus truncatus]
MVYRCVVIFCVIWRTWSSTITWTVPSSVMAAKRADTQTTIVLVRSPVSWPEAAEGCKKIGATLTRIDNEYMQMVVTSFARKEWSNDWKEAWFALRWSNSNTEIIWADNCDTFNSSSWNMFDSSANGNAKVNYGCYSNVLVADDSKSSLYDSVVNTQLTAVDLTRSSPTDCREMCDKVYGCYLASYLGNGSCILGVISNTSNTYIRSNIFLADNYTLTAVQSQSISSKQTYNCTSVIENSTVTATISTQNNTEASGAESSTSSATNLTHQSDVELSTQMTSSLCVPSIIRYNLTQEEKEDLISAIISELIVDAKSTLKSQSQRTSAEDERPSAQALGYVAVGVICFVVCVIFAIDAPNVYFCLQDHRKVGSTQ